MHISTGYCWHWQTAILLFVINRYYDGTGGNNHAVDYYAETGYPLAVKLGTITAEGGGEYVPYTCR